MLTTDNAALYERLASRGYTPAKITANVECEIMRVCADEAGEAYDEAIVKVLPSNSVEEMEENVAWVAALVDKVSGSGGGGGGGGQGRTTARVWPPLPPPLFSSVFFFHLSGTIFSARRRVVVRECPPPVLCVCQLCVNCACVLFCKTISLRLPPAPCSHC